MSNCVNKGCAAYKGPCLNDMPGVVCYGFKPRITNYDRIISKTPEELADWLAKNDPECDPPEWWLEWLREEAE